MNERESRFKIDLEGVQLLGRYGVKAALGRGGMATVYLGHDDTLDMPVVVKVPHVALLAEPGFADRFQKEIQDLVTLQHPHIVTILARGEYEELPFLVQQYLSGGSLDDQMANAGGRLTLDQVEPWIEDVARALDFMHAREVIHRDVKPGNILFDEHGHVYLSDFGIAKAIGEADTGLTVTGMTPGSPLYMAPEQAKGTAVSGASDQYALAATVFEALSGQPPFRGQNIVDVLMRKAGQDAPSVTEFVSVPDPARMALARALDRDPEARFESCRAFAKALVVDGATATAPRPQAPAATPSRSVPPRPPPPPPRAVTDPSPVEAVSGTSSSGTRQLTILALTLGGSLVILFGFFSLLLGRGDDGEGVGPTSVPTPAGDGVIRMAGSDKPDPRLIGAFEPDWDVIAKHGSSGAGRRRMLLRLRLTVLANGHFTMNFSTRKRANGNWRHRTAGGDWHAQGGGERITLDATTIDGDDAPFLQNAALELKGDFVVLHLERETFPVKRE